MAKLDVAQLETWQKKDLQSLAKQLGVSDEGTVKELAARCAEVEVGYDAAAVVETAEAEAATIVAKAKEEAAQIVAEAKKNEAIKDVTIECTERYYDTFLERVVEAGEQIDVTEKRANQVIKAGYAKLVINGQE